MSKLTELELLKYWIDTEFTIVHIMFGFIMLELTEGLFWSVVLGVYIAYSMFYAFTRLAIVAANDPNYLKVPKVTKK